MTLLLLLFLFLVFPISAKAKIIRFSINDNQISYQAWENKSNFLNNKVNDDKPYSSTKKDKFLTQEILG